MKSAGILGTGYYLPEKCVTNDDIAAMGLDTTHDWIVERTGIHTRHIIGDNQATSDMAVEAARSAIAAAGLQPSEIDLIIVGTTSQDFVGFPSTACLVQHKLGITGCGAFDVAAACTGYNYAITAGAQFIQTGFAKHVLVIGADCLSRFVDWTDRSICILFGDGAGAAVLSEAKPGYGILYSDLNADGGQSEILAIESVHGSMRDRSKLHRQATEVPSMYMNGKAVYKVAVNNIEASIVRALDSCGLTPGDVNWLVPHQANLRIIDFLRNRLLLREDQVLLNIHKYGNTSAASIPIAVAEASEAGQLKPGDIVVMAGFGGGFTWATTIVRWGGV